MRWVKLHAGADRGPFVESGFVAVGKNQPAPTQTSRRATLAALFGGAWVFLGAADNDIRALPTRRRKRRRHRKQAIATIPKHDACDPDAMSGIAGLVLIGPMCPVVTQDDPCPDRPFAAKIAVRDEAGRIVCLTRSGDDGRFRLGLSPGVYELVPENGEFGLPYAQPQTVTVLAGRYAEVQVSYDSGIR